jgi:hypothetical protein
VKDVYRTTLGLTFSSASAISWVFLSRAHFTAAEVKSKEKVRGNLVRDGPAADGAILSGLGTFQVFNLKNVLHRVFSCLCATLLSLTMRGERKKTRCRVVIVA